MKQFYLHNENGYTHDIYIKTVPGPFSVQKSSFLVYNFHYQDETASFVWRIPAFKGLLRDLVSEHDSFVIICYHTVEYSVRSHNDVKYYNGTKITENTNLRWHLGELGAGISIPIMTPSNGNIFRVTGPLWGETTGGFPSQRPVTRSFDVFFDLLEKTSPPYDS